MKKILWISRHKMSCEQTSDLQRIYGAYQIIQWEHTVDSLAEIQEMLDKVDVIAAVLPLPLLAQVVKQGKPVIFAKSKRVQKKSFHVLEPQFRFVHDGWVEIESLEVNLRER